MKKYFFLIIITLLCVSNLAFSQVSESKFENGTGPATHNYVIRSGGDPCDTLTLFETLEMNPTGLAWDGHYLWVSDGGYQQISLYDTLGNLYKSIAGKFNNLAYADGIMWGIKEQEALLVKLDTATGMSMEQFQLPSFGKSDPNGWGLTWDGENLWHSEYGFETTIYKISPTDGSVLHSFVIPAVSLISITWVNPYLYGISRAEEKMYRIDPASGVFLDSIDWCVPQPLGLVYNKNYFMNISTMIFLGGNQSVYKITPAPRLLPVIEQFPQPVVDVFPNPAGERLFIRGAKNGAVLQLYDFTGALLMQGKYDDGSGTDVSLLARGIYLLRIVCGQEVMTKRIFLK